MEEQWINNLRQRFEDRQQPAPGGLWDSIEAAMTERGACNGAPVQAQRHARMVSMWARRVIAAAACVIIIICVTIGLMNLDNTGGNAVATLSADKTVTTASIGNSVEGADEASPASEPKGVVARTLGRLTAALKKAVDEKAGTAAAEQPVLAANNVETDSQTSSVTTEKVKTGSTGKSVLGRYTPSTDNRNNNSYTAQHPRKLPPTAPHRVQNGVSVGVYGTGITTSNSTAPGGNPVLSNPAQQSTQFTNSGIMLMANPIVKGELAEMEPDEVHVKHRQPVKVGVSARFRLTDRLALESGLYYTYLSSDFEYGDNTGGTRKEQRLHYIGLPAKLNVSMWRNDRMEVYAGAGGAVEIGVSGNTHTLRMDDNGAQSSRTESTRDKRPQFSANASAGVQYNFNDLIGVYAEPGVSYYIDNGSGISNFYKDKPWNFNLSVGMRFTFR